MSVTYGFYNSLNGDRKYNAEQLSSIFDGIINDGIYMSIGTAMNVKPSSGLTVNVGPGRAWFNHTWTLNDSELLLTLEAADLLLNRIDAIVLEVNTSDEVRANAIKVIKGTPATNPVNPTLSKDGYLYQYPLAYIYVAKGATEITASEITNKVGTSDTPYVTGVIQTMNIDNLVAQWQSQWNDWRKSIENENTNWTAAQRAAWTTWVNTQESEFTTWVTNYKNELLAFQNTTESDVASWYETKQTEFTSWFENIRNQLSEDAAGNLQNQIDALNARVDNEIVINHEFKDKTFLLSDGQDFPFSDDQMNQYYKIASLYLNNKLNKLYNNSIVYVWKDSNYKYITCIMSSEKDARHAMYVNVYQDINTKAFYDTTTEAEILLNKTQTISEESTHTEYPSAQAVRNYVVDNGGGSDDVIGQSLVSSASKYVINANSKSSNPYQQGRKINLIPNVLDQAINMTSVNSDLTGSYSTESAAVSAGYSFSGDFSSSWGILYKSSANTSNAKVHLNSETDVKELIMNLPEIMYASGFAITVQYNGNMTIIAEGPDGSISMNVAKNGSAKYIDINLPDGANPVFRVNKITIRVTGYYSNTTSAYQYTTIQRFYIKGYNKGFNTSLPVYLNINNLGERLLNCPLTSNDNKNMLMLYHNKPDNATNGVYELLSSNGNSFSAKSGTIAHGGTIPKTPGYKNYMYFVSINNVSSISSDNQEYTAGFQSECSVIQSTRVVSVRARTYYYTNGNINGWLSWSNGTANYLELAWN